MAQFAGGKIEAFVGPKELGAADDLEAVIVEFIGRAKASLDIAVQELDSQPIAQAILDASWRGISVRMFLEQDYLLDDDLPEARPKAGQSKQSAVRSAQWTERRRPADCRTNRDILAALLRNKVDVKADLNPKIFHQKFVVRDYRQSARKTSAILAGSTNFTHTGTHKNLNHVIIFRDHRICKAYQAEFQEIREGTFGALNERHRRLPRTVNLNGVPVRVLFAPDDSPELEIIKQMLKCQKQLDFAIFTFSGSSGIDDAMAALRAGKRRIRGVVDASQGLRDWAATYWLHGQGIQVFVPEKKKAFKKLGKLHHKLMVIDDAIVVAGSMNYTAPANEYNDENIFVIGNPYKDLPKSKGGPVDLKECAKIAKFFREEIARIIRNSRKYEP